MTKRGGSGKRKGGGFERKVCNLLSRWIAPDSEETLFWRSAMSGGRATVRSKRGIKDNTQAGDITCIHPDGSWLTNAFAIECKFYKNLNIQASLLENKGKLLKFWRQACKQAERHALAPMLIAKENQSPVLLLVSLKGRDILMPKNGPCVVWNLIGGKVCVYDFNEFLQGEGVNVNARNSRSSSGQQSTKRRSVEPIPLAKGKDKSSRDKAAANTRRPNKRKRPARRISR